MTLGIQPTHIIIILIVGLLIFGPKRLPEIGRNIGKAINQFRNGTREISDNFSKVMMEPTGLQSDYPGTGNSQNAEGRIAMPYQPAISPVRGGNYCIHCGASNQAEALFCNQCGTKLPEKTIQLPGMSASNQ